MNIKNYILIYYENGEQSEESNKLTFENCQKAIIYLKKIMFSIDYYDIVLDNIMELLRDLEYHSQNDNNLFNLINRRMFNFLDTFYAYLEFHEKNYKSIFDAIKREYYDMFFEYRLVYNIRRYMIHCDLAVTELRFDVGSEKTTMIINMKDIISKKTESLQARLINEIKEQNINTIDVEELAKKFRKIFLSIQEKIMNTLLKETVDKLDLLYKSIKKDSNHRLVETYIEERNGKYNKISIQYEYLRFMQKLTNKFPNIIFYKFD